MLARLTLTAALFAAPFAASAAEPDGPTRLIGRAEAISIGVLSALESRRGGVTKTERAALGQFYGRVGRPLLFIGAGLQPARVAALTEQIGAARDYGLEPSDYDLPRAGESGESAPVPAMAALELRYSLAALAYARHASSGRLDTTQLGEFIDPSPHRADPALLLADIERGEKPLGSLLLAYHPVHEQFWSLRDALLKLRGGAVPAAQTESAENVPDGETLFPGDRNASIIPIVRARLKLAAPEDSDDEDLYDRELERAVRAFQRQAGLRAEGIIGRSTRNALNGDTAESTPRGGPSETQILSNMERWRWMPRSFGERYVWVNLPEFLVRLQEGNRLVHEERIVIGTPKNKTPIFSDTMETVVINPYWTVPESIITKEILPIAQRNPGYIARQRMEIFYGGRKRNVDPYGVDWSSVDPTKLTLRQTPGDHNALGNIKFEFPNAHAVYMHDTPQKALFASNSRAFSHGCMRVRNPKRFAEILIGPQGWNLPRIERAIATGENQGVKLTQKLPVHMMYFTLWRGDDGQFRSFRDVYGYDAMVSGALQLAGERESRAGRG